MRSISATQALGVAMLDATTGLDLGIAEDKTVTVSSLGFEKDEFGQYLRLVTEEAVYASGGTVVADGEIRAELHVHLGGIERIHKFFFPIFDTTRLVAKIDAELVVRDRSGTILSRQALDGSAMYQETVILQFFTTPGSYYVERNNAWVKVESGPWFADEWYAQAKLWLRRNSKEEAD